MPQVLTEAQIAQYQRDGYVVVEDVLSPEQLAQVRQVTDDYVEGSRTVTKHDSVL